MYDLPDISLVCINLKSSGWNLQKLFILNTGYQKFKYLYNHLKLINVPENDLAS